MVQQRILMASPANQFVFNCTPKVKNFLLHEGTDPKYGARHLKRAIERNIVFPLANLVATGQVRLGDFIRIDMSPEGRSYVHQGSGGRDGADASGTLRAAAGSGADGGKSCASTVNRREFGATGTLDSK